MAYVMSETSFLAANSSNITTNVAEQSGDSSFMRLLNIGLDLFFVPVIIVFGIVGNILSLVIFSTPRLNVLSSSVYLSALAVADTGFLVGVLFSWLSNLGLPLYHYQGFCQTFVYLTFVCSFLSAWYIVAFSAERLVVVLFPLRRATLCTPARAKIVVISLAILAAVMYNFAFWTTSVQDVFGERLCMQITRFTPMLMVISKVDTIVTLVLPFTAIACINGRIICISTRLGNVGANNESCNNQPSGGSGESLTVHSRRRTNQAKITRMLLVVSTAFLILNLPFHSIRLYPVIYQLFHREAFIPSRFLQRLQTFFMYVFYINYSINFVLYSICGQNFRQELCSCIRECSMRKRSRSFSTGSKMTMRTGSATYNETQRRRASGKGTSLTQLI